MSVSIENISTKFDRLKRHYDKGTNNLQLIGDIATDALHLLQEAGTATVDQGDIKLVTVTGDALVGATETVEEETGSRDVLTDDELTVVAVSEIDIEESGGQRKVYQVKRRNGSLSRPIREDLFIADPEAFDRSWKELIKAIERSKDKGLRERTVTTSNLDSILYTTVIAFAASYDLYKPKSRKTPGTFFEVTVGTLLGEFAGLTRGKQVALPGTRDKVPTDIVLKGPEGKPSLVIPTKITTRERIVQVWVHQRILDSAFNTSGNQQYKTVLVAVNEIQRDGEKGVNEICVPGQVRLYQNYIAKLSGMYYLDPPLAYTKSEFSRSLSSLPVKTMSALLTGDLATLLDL